MTLFFVFD